MSPHLQHFRVLAAYNSWMNQRLYGVAEGLSDAERKRDLGAYFKSVHGTLNHLLVADRFLLGRFKAFGRAWPALGAADLLDDFVPDQELYAEFERLQQERRRTDGTIERWIAELSDADLGAVLPSGRPFWLMLVHFFNHQTHHRGQLTTLFTQLGRDPGVTDLSALPDDRRG